ncbi:MAG: ATP-dependent sacrificial sulfur transferase LarE [Nitrospiraceae bacterium]|nr:ATP-dependent sacrificial sulfur transferase LarE [Nitrospiraceae bacterium]
MLYTKLSKLLDILEKMRTAVIAYSGGVDSTFLIKAVKLSGIKALAVTAFSETMPEDDLACAKKFAGEIGIDHRIIGTSELDSDKFRSNSPDRCFFCKDELFTKIKEIASNEGYDFILDGSNLDDMKDFRPGRKAAGKYLVRSPLVEAELTKDEIKKLSKKLNIPLWNRPASPCLASRFPYGEAITLEALKQISRAESFIKSLGFKEFRVRHHGDTARIELNKNDFKKMLNKNIKKSVVGKLRSLGYKFISLDLEEFRSGRMNETIKISEDIS